MVDSPPQLALSIGDRVVYPNQGVCRVASVQNREVAGQTLKFVTMHREEDGAVMMVPEGKIKSIGIRKVASADEIKKMLAYLKSDAMGANLDWKQRARSNLERMTQGGILGLAEVVKSLQVLSELRPLPPKERELYDNARHLIVRELTAAVGLSPCDAEDTIDIALFPPGRERPKRTAAEFTTGAEAASDEVDLPDELRDLDDALELPAEPDPPEEAEAEATEGDEIEGEEEEPEKPRRAAKAASSRDDEKTEPMGGLKKLLVAMAKGQTRAAEKPKGSPPKKRGRPPKGAPATASAQKESKPAKKKAAPAKRGRPRK